MQIVFTTGFSFRTVAIVNVVSLPLTSLETLKLLRMLKCQSYLYRPMYVNLSEWKYNQYQIFDALNLKYHQNNNKYIA